MTQHLLVRTARGEAVERPPVWAMRQAGRWDPEFNKLRAGKTFYEFSENVELSAAASLLPRRFGVDAIILFYDITTLTVAMGRPVHARGPDAARCRIVPSAAGPTSTGLRPCPMPTDFATFWTCLPQVKADLRGELPVIVFAGAPFTLADVLHRHRERPGGHPTIRRRAAGHLGRALLDRIESATVHFLTALVRAGADVYQLFDSWAGGLDARRVRNWAYAPSPPIFDAVAGVPAHPVRQGVPLPRIDDARPGPTWSASVRAHDLAAARRRYPQPGFSGQRQRRIDADRERRSRSPRRPGNASGPAAGNGTSSISATAWTATCRWPTSRRSFGRRKNRCRRPCRVGFVAPQLDYEMIVASFVSRSARAHAANEQLLVSPGRPAVQLDLRPLNAEQAA